MIAAGIDSNSNDAIVDAIVLSHIEIFNGASFVMVKGDERVVMGDTPSVQSVVIHVPVVCWTYKPQYTTYVYS